MHLLLQEIQTVLTEKYPNGFGIVFLGNAINPKLSVEDFKAHINLPLPEIFYEFYSWALDHSFEEEDVSDQTEITDFEEEYFPSLYDILKNTRDWQEILKKNPDREWKSGFVEIGTWDDAYVKVIDTLGEVGEAGNIISWDFKGGGVYTIIHKDYGMFLKTRLERLKENLYFPPDPEDDDAQEEFRYGQTRQQIESLERKLNEAIYKDIEFDF